MSASRLIPFLCMAIAGCAPLTQSKKPFDSIEEGFSARDMGDGHFYVKYVGPRGSGSREIHEELLRHMNSFCRPWFVLSQEEETFVSDSSDALGPRPALSAAAKCDKHQIREPSDVLKSGD